MDGGQRQAWPLGLGCRRLEVPQLGKTLDTYAWIESLLSVSVSWFMVSLLHWLGSSIFLRISSWLGATA